MVKVLKATPDFMHMAAEAHKRYCELNEHIHAFNMRVKETTVTPEDIDRIDAMHFERDILVEEYGLDVLSA